MKPFMDANFLLTTETAQHLYHHHAAKMPIIDYHCHLSPQMIAEDYRFKTITELWLGGDHYKWRAMRANGVSEEYITGNASDWEKFQKWAETVPYTFRNPLYHWTHLELRTAFGITETLNPDSAKRIYDACNAKLTEEGMSARGLMKHYNVKVVCTTDDPIDSLEYHRSIRESGFEIKVLPTWRPDKAMAVNDSANYQKYIAQLGLVTGIHIQSYTQLLEALQKRHDFFASEGCKVADHGVSAFPWAECTETEAASLFEKVITGNELQAEEVTKLQTAILLELCRMNHAKGWVQQFHFGPMRNVNSRMFRQLGPDTGFDTIGDYTNGQALAHFLDALNADGRLTKTILYNINPGENAVIAAMCANFQDGSIPGKIQFGSGWWFNDQIDGMEQQMNTLSLQGLLSRFVGMLTDSRSFVSYPRHEYFRRILCNLIGKDVEEGLIPESEMPRVENMIEDICYNNAKEYFNF
ncbi:MAG: glucuronate isomerase [Bacteroides sp.]|nr:glucuronate isomerase [Bacteroides sp.]